MKIDFKRKKIRRRKSLNRILSETREKKGITLEQAELDTGIRLAYLKSLEKNRFSDLPSEVYKIGFLRRYADYLGLDKTELVQEYKNYKETGEYWQKSEPSIDGKKISSPFSVGKPKFFSPIKHLIFTPQMILSVLIGFFVLTLASYVWFQVKSFAAAPPLEVKNPVSEIVISLQTIPIEGKTDSGAILLINDQPVPIDGDGHFVQEIKLSEGLNAIEVTARNKAGKETKKTIQVLVK